jgi:hypothetical protein
LIRSILRHLHLIVSAIGKGYSWIHKLFGGLAIATERKEGRREGWRDERLSVSKPLTGTRSARTEEILELSRALQRWLEGTHELLMLCVAKVDIETSFSAFWTTEVRWSAAEAAFCL